MLVITLMGSMGIALDWSVYTSKSQLGASGSTGAEISSGRPEKSSEQRPSPTDLPTVLRESIVRLAGERSWSDNRDTWLNRAARAASITPRQAKSLFYMESDNPSGVVVFNVLRAVNRLDEKLAWSRPAGGNQ
jgi:hypothetical protein